MGETEALTERSNEEKHELLCDGNQVEMVLGSILKEIKQWKRIQTKEILLARSLKMLKWFFYSIPFQRFLSQKTNVWILLKRLMCCPINQKMQGRIVILTKLSQGGNS